MSGEISGLNMAEALASLPSWTDRDLARQFFIIAEIQTLSVLRSKSDDEQEKRKDADRNR
jgi:hypothetical protein